MITTKQIQKPRVDSQKIKRRQQKRRQQKRKQTHRYKEQTNGYQWGEKRGKGHYRGRRLRGTNYYV